MSQALLLVDLQNDFCCNGALAVENADCVIPVANRLIQLFKAQNKKVIATLDWHPATHKSFAVNSAKQVGETGELEGLPQLFWPVHCVQQSKGADFHPDLHKAQIDQIIYKGEHELIDSYSAFFDNAKRSHTILNKYLKKEGIDTLFVMGLATDYCVKFSVLDGQELGYSMYVITDGCKGVNLKPQDSELALKEMQQAGAILIDSIDSCLAKF